MDVSANIIVHWVSELQEQQICPPGAVKYSCHTWCNVASLMQRDGRWNLLGWGGSTTERPVIFNGRQSFWQFTLAAADAEIFMFYIPLSQAYMTYHQEITL